MRTLLGLLLPLLVACGAARSREADRPYTGGLARVESLAVVSAVAPASVVRVVARGTLPDACTELHREERERRGSRIQITLTTRRESGASCPEAPRPFTRTLVIPVAELYPGLYTLDVNGVRETLDVPRHDQLHEDLHRREIE